VADDDRDCQCPRPAPGASPRATVHYPLMSLIDPRPTRRTQEGALPEQPFAAQLQRVRVSRFDAQGGRR
jgi:hypothetical protein